jgi:septal ring factor EnvC (AmiA/AmiB activator)
MCKLIFFNKLVQNIRRDDEIRDDDRDDDRDEINNEISRNENSRESSRDENSDLNTQMLKNVAEIIESIEIHVAIFHESAQLDTDSTSLRY